MYLNNKNKSTIPRANPITITVKQHDSWNTIKHNTTLLVHEYTSKHARHYLTTHTFVFYHHFVKENLHFKCIKSLDATVPCGGFRRLTLRGAADAARTHLSRYRLLSFPPSRSPISGCNRQTGMINVYNFDDERKLLVKKLICNFMKFAMETIGSY